ARALLARAHVLCTPARSPRDSQRVTKHAASTCTDDAPVDIGTSQQELSPPFRQRGRRRRGFFRCSAVRRLPVTHCRHPLSFPLPPALLFDGPLPFPPALLSDGPLPLPLPAPLLFDGPLPLPPALLFDGPLPSLGLSLGPLSLAPSPLVCSV